MTTVETPQYIKALLAPTKNSRGSRRAWSIDVESVWVPFFTATNVMGETNLADDVLGAPIRLAKSPDGEVRFTQSGRPVMRVHPELNSQIGIVRENFVAGLQAYTGSVLEERPDAYGEQVAKAQAAGQPIMEADQTDIDGATEKCGNRPKRPPQRAKLPPTPPRPKIRQLRVGHGATRPKRPTLSRPRPRLAKS